jgi:hypothetical protein
MNPIEPFLVVTLDLLSGPRTSESPPTVEAEEAELVDWS